MTMIRTGIGRFHPADFDTFEAADFNRRFGATVSSLSRSKLDAMVEHALSVNPNAGIKTFPAGARPMSTISFPEYNLPVPIFSSPFFLLEALQ